MMAMELPHNFTSALNHHHDPHDDHPENPLDTAAAVLLGLCCAVGIPGNAAVLAVFGRRLEKDNFTQRLILNLACCDLLCLATIPMWMYSLLHGYDLSDALCKFFVFLVFWSLYANVQMVTLMSVQRYIQVLHRHRWARLGHRGEGALLLALWGLAVVMTAPSVPTWGVIDRHEHDHCNRYQGTDGPKLGALIFEILMEFVLPLAVIVSSYSCLQRKVRRKAQFSGTQRMSRLIIRIVLIFVLSWVPVHVLNVIDIVIILLSDSHRADLAADLGHFKDKVEIFAHCTMFISASVNPFLYAFAFRRIWAKPTEDNNKPTKSVENSVETTV